MCTYHHLTNSKFGSIKWCEKCGIFHLEFGNIAMNFNVESFSGFKENLLACYQHYSGAECCRNQRSIIFNTRIEGMQLLFSTEEVGNLLAMMQEAELEQMMI